MKILTIVALAVVALFLAACGDDTPPPSEPLAVRDVLPAQLRTGSEALVMVVGSGFRDGASVSLNGRRLTETTFVNQALLATVVPAGTAIGTYPVTVTLPDGSSARAPASITIVEGRPSPAPSVSPSPTASPSPSPAATPTPAPSPAPTPTPEPRPTATPAPMPTPAPTAAPTPPPSAAPTRTAAPAMPTQPPAPTPSPIFFPPTVPPTPPPGTPAPSR